MSTFWCVNQRGTYHILHRNICSFGGYMFSNGRMFSEDMSSPFCLNRITSKNKFNVLQQATYATIMFALLPPQMVARVFLWQIKQFENYIDLMGGIKIVNTIHVLLFFFSSLLWLAIYMTTFGHTPLAHIKSMFTGYEEA